MLTLLMNFSRLRCINRQMLAISKMFLNHPHPDLPHRNSIKCTVKDLGMKMKLLKSLDFIQIWNFLDLRVANNRLIRAVLINRWTKDTDIKINTIINLNRRSECRRSIVWACLDPPPRRRHRKVTWRPNKKTVWFQIVPVQEFLI